ncbi:MAG: sigma-70 family RNA polymerase sigma factor [Acidobacteriota bacterium]
MAGSSTNPPFWMPASDRKGRPIPPDLMEVARLIWPRVAYLVERELKDGSRAAEVLEKAVSIVSSVMYRKGPQERILNPESYLYWVAARILYRVIEREKMIQFMDDLEPVASPKLGFYRDRLSKTEQKLFMKQAMRYMDSRTRSLFLLRVKGYSWAEIGEFMGITANHATVLFSSGIERARRRILRQSAAKAKPAAGRAR